MPSPLGHFLAGLAVGIATDPEPPPTRRPLREHLTGFALACGALAAAPDLDLLLHKTLLGEFHRTATHSVTAVALVLIIGVLVTGKVTRRRSRWWAVVFAAAWGTHLLMDWLGADPSRPPGQQLLWPFSDRYFISGIDFFPSTERNFHGEKFLIRNMIAGVTELAVGIPLVALGWLLGLPRRMAVGRRLKRGATTS